MELNDYQNQASLTAIYPKNKGLEYCILGLVGESGELANKYKKFLRGDVFRLNKDCLASELGDVLWYISQLANELGYDLEVIAEMNLTKLEIRQRNNTLQGNGDDR